MSGTKAEKAAALLRKAQQLLKDVDNKNLKKATDYIRVSIRLISRP